MKHNHRIVAPQRIDYLKNKPFSFIKMEIETMSFTNRTNNRNGDKTTTADLIHTNVAIITYKSFG
jgi:hypothetical protein